MVIIRFNMFFSGPASWSSRNAFVSGAGGLTFQSQDGPIQKWCPRRRRWPRGHIFKSLVLALASKLRSLAWVSKPKSPRKCPVLGSRTAFFLLVEKKIQHM